MPGTSSWKVLQLFLLSHHWLPTPTPAVGEVSTKGHAKRSSRNLRHVCIMNKHIHTELRQASVYVVTICMYTYSRCLGHLKSDFARTMFQDRLESCSDLLA